MEVPEEVNLIAGLDPEFLPHLRGERDLAL
jgi:hypothetical protein